MHSGVPCTDATMVGTCRSPNGPGAVRTCGRLRSSLFRLSCVFGVASFLGPPGGTTTTAPALSSSLSAILALNLIDHQTDPSLITWSLSCLCNFPIPCIIARLTSAIYVCLRFRRPFRWHFFFLWKETRTGDDTRTEIGVFWEERRKGKRRLAGA